MASATTDNMEYDIDDDEYYPEELPPELDRFNWGAFLLNWIWGIGNNTFIAFLCFVPMLNIIMPFVLGFKGSQWAWKNGNWKSLEHFKSVQRKWAIAGILVVCGCLFWAILVIGIFGGLFFFLQDSDDKAMATQIFVKSPLCEEYTGQPVDAGFALGNFNVTPTSGYADMSFSVTGPKGEGDIYYKAEKSMGQWKIKSIQFKDSTGKYHKLDPKSINDNFYNPDDSKGSKQKE